MLRFFFVLLLASCSMGTVKTGGQDSYLYDQKREYTAEEIKEFSPKVVQTSMREPQVGKLSELFGKGQKPLKRVGLVIFESEIQPTREGLAKKNFVYLSEAGKQIMTENLLEIFEKSMGLLASDIDFVEASKFIPTKAFNQYGLAEDDYVLAKRDHLAPDDIFFLEPGKKTTTTTILNPRGMRDMSFLLVPAFEMMGGPKWSEQNKQFLNDIAKEMNLDAVIIAMSEVRWTAAHTDKHSGEHYPEEIKVKLRTATLIPLTRYHERLEKIGNKEKPNVTLCYRNYESEIRIPATIAAPVEEQNFETINREILLPAFKTYKDLAQMTVLRLAEDLKATW